jgi:hypothetical protein
MRRPWLLAVVAMLAIMLAACGGSPAAQQSTMPVELPSEATPNPESTADLAAMKKAAGIANCPASDPKSRRYPPDFPMLSCPASAAAVTFGSPDYVASHDDQRLGAMVWTLPRGSALSH